MRLGDSEKVGQHRPRIPVDMPPAALPVLPRCPPGDAGDQEERRVRRQIAISSSVGHEAAMVTGPQSLEGEHVRGEVVHAGVESPEIAADVESPEIAADNADNVALDRVQVAGRGGGPEVHPVPATPEDPGHTTGEEQQPGEQANVGTCRRGTVASR